MTAVEQPEAVAADVDALVLEAGSGRVLRVSDSLLAWTGYGDDDLIGLPVWDTLATGSLAETLRATHEHATCSALSGVVEGPVATAAGELHETRWAQVPVEDGAVGRVVLTALATLVAPTQEPVVDVAPSDVPSALDRVTRGLLETLSHELRTPVASVTGYAELLREGEAGQLTMMQRKFVGAITRNSERLRGLADQLLLIGGLESDPTRLELGVLDLREVVSSVRVSRAASGLERVTVELQPGDVELPVRGDRHRLVQAVEELVGNAAKFTLGNGTVSCSARADGDHALVEVVDDGVGLGDDAEVASLFLPFYRSRAVRVRGVPGAGLGLTFAAAVVRGHGGEVTAVPGADGGSVFTVRVPLAPTAAPEVEDDDRPE